MRQIAITVLVTVDEPFVRQTAERALRARPATLPDVADQQALEGLRADLECRVSDSVRSHNGIVPGAGVTTTATIIEEPASAAV